ncbi:RICIN domain-containing protein [Micromonospora chokoriensis]
MKSRMFGKIAIALMSLAASTGVAVVTTPASAEAASIVIRFSNAATGRYIDSNAAGSAYTLPNNSGPYQAWNVSIDDTFTITNVATGRCLDHNVALKRVTTGPCTPNNPYQKWNLLINGLMQNEASGQCLDDNRALNRLTATGCDAGNPYRIWRQHL